MELTDSGQGYDPGYAKKKHHPEDAEHIANQYALDPSELDSFLFLYLYIYGRVPRRLQEKIINYLNLAKLSLMNTFV